MKRKRSIGMKIQNDAQGKEFDSVFSLYLDSIRLGERVLLEGEKKTQLNNIKQHKVYASILK